jgi:hypothetical protein
MDVPQLVRCVEQGELETEWLICLLLDFFDRPISECLVESLMAIAAAEKIYSNLRGAKVYLQVTFLHDQQVQLVDQVPEIRTADIKGYI